MTVTTFEDRLARMARETEARPATPPADQPALSGPAPSPMRKLGGSMLGAILGGLIGLLIEFCLLPGSPLGPGTAYGETVLLIAMALAALVVLAGLAASFMFRRRPAFFACAMAAWLGLLVAVLI